jgi:tight adherence protein C
MNLLILTLMILAAAYCVRIIYTAAAHRRAARLVDVSIQAPPSGLLGDDREDRWLTSWLSHAGFRGPSARSEFLAATAGLAALGLAIVFLMNRLGVVAAMVQTLSILPGGVGDVLSVVAVMGPYIVLTILTLAPTLVVRAARRNRVEAVEQDLAPTLELLATLAEAGLSFDSGIARIQESETGKRPLTQEFQIYQRDALGGIPRLESLRRLERRLNVTSVSIFVSALVQSEQVGASLSETLRSQADDLRDRRKLRALVLAQALPVKLVFPLIFCFLPGIFYSTLGPVINQFVGIADAVLRGR